MTHIFSKQKRQTKIHLGNWRQFSREKPHLCVIKSLGSTSHTVTSVMCHHQDDYTFNRGIPIKPSQPSPLLGGVYLQQISSHVSKDGRKIPHADFFAMRGIRISTNEFVWENTQRTLRFFQTIHLWLKVVADAAGPNVCWNTKQEHNVGLRWIEIHWIPAYKGVILSGLLGNNEQ